MSGTSMSVTVLAAVAMAAAAGPGWAAPPPGPAIYTTYNFYNNNTQINWVTCGATAESSGCFGSGIISGFGNVCSVLDTIPVTKGEVTKQLLYIFDDSFNGAKTLTLDVYEKTDVTTSSANTTTFKLLKTVPLPAASTAVSKCYVAANANYIVAGTSVSLDAVEISKTSFATSALGGFSPPIPLSSILVDAQGYISVNFNGSQAGESGFYLIGPNGAGEEDGGGNALVFNTKSGYP
jgi:hypothetical protein